MFARLTWEEGGCLDVGVKIAAVRDPRASWFAGNRPWFLVKFIEALDRYAEWPPGAIVVICVEAARERRWDTRWHTAASYVRYISRSAVSGVSEGAVRDRHALCDLVDAFEASTP